MITEPQNLNSLIKFTKCLNDFTLHNDIKLKYLEKIKSSSLTIVEQNYDLLIQINKLELLKENYLKMAALDKSLYHSLEPNMNLEFVADSMCAIIQEHNILIEQIRESELFNNDPSEL